MSEVESSRSKPSGADAVADPFITERRGARFSWIWLVPLVAAIVGLSFIVRTWINTGPTITIAFESAEGLEIGQTKVRYKDVVVGLVTDIKVSNDRSNVLVMAQLDRDASHYLAREGARYWVVKPRLSLGSVSGLGTLLSGAYISADVSPDIAENPSTAYKFTGLEKPPAVTNDRSGTRFTLRATELGSLEIGSPIYYRQIAVGRVIDYALADEGTSVDIQVFIDAPNDRFVTSDARFWNISGINVSLSTAGVNVQTGSLASVISGGISFASANPANEIPAQADAVYDLFRTEVEAMAEPDGPPFRVDLVFNQSVRGLKVGAPVEFRGMELGKVYDIDLEFDDETKRFHVLVKTNLYPRRFGNAYDGLMKLESASQHPGSLLLGPMVKHGLRAQLQAASLLTGQQFVALEFFPDADPVEFDPKREPLVLPTIAGNFDRLQEQISAIVTKLNAVPFEGIGNDLRDGLKSMNAMLKEINTKVAPQAAAALKAAQKSLESVDSLLSADSPTGNNLDRTLRELSGAARSLRNLGDYLQAHPNALITGRASDRLPE
ncbi:intermembrane transport protein PqiB [Pusillimonas sp. NJUB218]|uniref:PqiB family protein n=1 Tax=Pusillimonas sp. NJUB218 TaxID=2023230 RepID=UPI000F4AF9AE|nr:MlaD family protein [Pusillimonas sp. NJUB218]ROT46298.1 paraquat-inducible protein B [Pusillimonas sp. NJUB218]